MRNPHAQATSLVDPKMREFHDTSALSGSNAAYVEDLYEAFLENPDALDPDFRAYFSALQKEMPAASELKHSDMRARFSRMAAERGVAQATVSDDHAVPFMQCVEVLRHYGHFSAKLDPLGLAAADLSPNMTLAHYQLNAKLPLSQRMLEAVKTLGLPAQATVGDAYEKLCAIYTGSVGFEYRHIGNSGIRRWLQERIEAGFLKRGQIAAVRKTRILEALVAAEGLERYLSAKFPGAKRFSLEGSDSLMVGLDTLIAGLSAAAVKEVVIGMAHRGRLNVLVNLLGKQPSDLFDEFSGKHHFTEGTGDVKYHQGFSTDVNTGAGAVHLSLAFNPSHLEIVSPVVCGSVKSRQVRRNDAAGKQVVPILVHGDAAFAGQGVVMETFSMSQTRGFGVGGAIHVVVNNQIGFTTSSIQDCRSTHYCTDVAKIIEAPIFHVNGDDPEAVAFVAELAADFRMQFGRDVVIDLVAYRKHGHNEADEPSATQPMMYQVIRKKETPAALYAKQLEAEQSIDASVYQQIADAYRQKLDNNDCVVKGLLPLGEAKETGYYPINWDVYLRARPEDDYVSTLPKQTLSRLGNKLTELPENFTLHARVSKIVADRKKMAAGEQPLDWGCAENLAYATLLEQGFSVRITGQDCGRGTFFHRHAALHEQKTGETYLPLAHLGTQARFDLYDSLLSEEAVLGFEYGYAASEPRTLVIWEAQFGDFANGAQVIFDQFLSSGEQKWGRLCGLALLLPHGHEGQGPEHSSARLERCLQLCAQENMSVCTPTTPAQIYHLLRRQVLRNIRRPLIVMSPKSFLRHRLAVSDLEALASGKFETLIDETDSTVKADKVRKVVLCGGKIYYDLCEQRLKNAETSNKQKNDVAIVRIEELYPFPEMAFRALSKKYAHVKDWVWCQEEPRNQGAWHYICDPIQECLGNNQRLRYIGRAAQAAPAVGYPSLHNAQQKQCIDDALA